MPSDIKCDQRKDLSNPRAGRLVLTMRKRIKKTMCTENDGKKLSQTSGALVERHGICSRERIPLGKTPYWWPLWDSSKWAERGFTLIELLLVVAIVAILIVLLFPEIARLRDGALSSKCVSNLRQLGSVARMSASDRNGQWMIVDPKVPYSIWSSVMIADGYTDLTNVMYCPALKPRLFSTYTTYGVNWRGLALAPDDVGVMNTKYFNGSVSDSSIKFNAINKPASFVLMADSFTARPAYGGSQYAIIQGSGPYDEIHLRHRNRANVLFADGHISSAGTDDLRAVGWRVAFKKDGTLTNF